MKKYLNSIAANKRRILNTIAVDNKKRVRPIPATVDKTRDRILKTESKIAGNNPNLPITPVPCSGTSFQCTVAGSGKTPIQDVSLAPSSYDKLATPLKEGGVLGTNFQPDFILNWQNNSVATPYTKESLKATYGFENFQ